MSTTVQFCTFTLDGLWFGVAVDRVQEIVRHLSFTRVPLAPSVVRGLMNLRGQIVTAIDLRRRLEFPDREANDENLPINVVIRTDDGLISLLVDQIGDVVVVDADSRDVAPSTLNGAARELIRGAYQFPNRLLLDLDLDRALVLDPHSSEASAKANASRAMSP